MKKIFVVIPNWNGADLIAECLESLQKQSLKSEIVVVDNGSVDESVSIIQAHFPDVHLVRLPENTGFSGGVNTGIEYAMSQNADAIALFNNDAVAEKSWLAELVRVMDENPEAGIITCKLIRADGLHLDSTGESYSVWGMPFPRGRNQKDKGQYDEQEAVFGATGGASLYRASMLREIGLFDQRFFAYYEDVDISFRAQLAGWKVVYTPTAVAYHHVSATSSKLGSFTRYHATKNFYLLYIKNMPGILFWKYLPRFVLQGCRLAASSFLRGSGWAYLQGYARAMLNVGHALRERRRIQQSRKVTTTYIDGLLYKQRPPRIPGL
jgi:GT2 family glycosyltransferase